MTFADLGLSPELLKAVEAAGYTEPTPIQAQAIPAVLMMKDILGIAQTGTGKTASFVLPMIDILASGRRRARMPRSLILEPTRELAAQVAENFEKYGENHDLKMALLIGGVQMGEQVKALDEGVDVLIATPGRLMDLFDRGKILLTGCELLVIDEADRMLDMGFIPDIESICDKLPPQLQTMLFSATMPPPIEKLSKKFMDNPKRIEVSRAASTSENIAQHKLMVSPRKKKDALRYFLRGDDMQTAIVFANRKTTVRELAKTLNRDGFAVGEIHGDMDQSSRIAELDRFKSGGINVLVASDVAARGLDVKGVSHVFNYDTPWHPDDYVHRIGRTGRAGATGYAYTFVTKADVEAIENIEKLTKTTIPLWTGEGASVSDGRNAGGSDANKSKRAKSSAKSTDNDASNDEAQEERPRKSRSRRTKQDDNAPAEQSERRSEAQSQPDSGSRGEKAHKDVEKADKRTKPRHKAAENEPTKPGDWNGPMPSFLGVSTTDQA